MTRVFFSGFETGDLSECIASGSAAVQTSVVRSGAYAGKLPAAGAADFQFGNESLTTAYQRLYFYISGLPSAFSDYFFNSNNLHTSIIRLGLNTDGTLTVTDHNAGVLGTGTIAIVPNTWTMVELKTVISAGSGVAEVRIGGVVDQTYTGLTTNYGGNVNNVDCYNNSNIDIYVDDFALDDAAYPGPGKVIARQGTAGTPTYDSWTKNGAATAALCWSDTPFSTATNCSDNVLSDKQTMLVWPFNTTQTGHGTDTIGTSDTINAAKVSAIAKVASAGNMDLLLRYGGSDNATTVTLTISDAYYESAFYIPTLANLNAAEIGANNDLTATLTTVEDCWLQVDYTSAPTSTLLFPNLAMLGL